MAERRMFSNQIVNSDAFHSLSTEAQVLYFNLVMSADNRGYINNAKSIISGLIGINTGHLEELVCHKFVLERDNFLYLIKHWYIHNDIPKSYIEESNYIDDLETLYFDPNFAYTIKMTKMPVLETIKTINHKKPLKENKVKEMKGNQNKVNENKVNIYSNNNEIEDEKVGVATENDNFDSLLNNDNVPEEITETFDLTANNWSKVLKVIENKLHDKPNFEAFFKDTTLVVINDDFVIDCPNRLSQTLLSGKYYDLVHDTIKECCKVERDLTFSYES